MSNLIALIESQRVQLVMTGMRNPLPPPPPDPTPFIVEVRMLLQDQAGANANVLSFTVVPGSHAAIQLHDRLAAATRALESNEGTVTIPLGDLLRGADGSPSHA